MGTISLIPNTTKEFNLIVFKFGKFYIESVCSDKIDHIDSIKTFDSEDGYTEIIVNGTEEYVCIEDNLLDLGFDTDLKKILKNDNELTIEECRSMNIEEMCDNCIFAIDGLFFFIDKNCRDYLKVNIRDKRNPNYRAELICKDIEKPFVIVTSTFKEGKRRYKMLYAAEINKKMMYDSWQEMK